MATHAIVLRILAVLASGLSPLQDSPSRQPYVHAAQLAGSDVLLFIVCRSGPEGGANECVGHGKFGACSPFAFFSGWPVALNEVGQVRFKQKSQSPRNYANITQMSVMTNHKDRAVGMAREKSDLIYEAFNAALTGQTHVFPNYQISGSAITGKMRRLCKSVGIEPSPKFWINLRASCERDLLTRYPIDQVASWLGHSPETALRHYNRVAKEQRTRDAACALRVEIPSRPEVISEAP